MDSGCSRHMTKNKKLFSSLIPLSHKEYVTFGDDKKGKVLGNGIIKINDDFTLSDVTLVDKLRYNLLSISLLVDANLEVLFRKFLILLSSVFLASLALEKSFKLIFLIAQSSVKCLIS
jgi:hypothetical protein